EAASPQLLLPHKPVVHLKNSDDESVQIQGRRSPCASAGLGAIVRRGDLVLYSTLRGASRM
ncbi:MAG: hypothetical protein AVDCRST_MAG28-3912, partial [uncultured Rubrobacteraceae bacterium]